LIVRKDFIHWAWVILSVCFIDLFINYSVRLGMGVVFPWIVNHFNWRYSWYFLGAGALVMVVVNGVFLRSSPESAGYLPWGQKESDSLNGLAEDGHPKIKLSTLFRDKTFWLIGLS